MNEFSLETLGITQLELILIITISLLASIIHEYMLTIKRFHDTRKLEIFRNILMTVTIDTIVDVIQLFIRKFNIFFINYPLIFSA